MVVDFIYNAAIIIVSFLLSSRLHEYLIKKGVSFKKIKYAISLGLSLFSYLAMLRPIQIAYFLIDFRAIPIFLISQIWGWRFGLITSILPVIYRIYLGGEAVWIGVVLILLSVVVGSAFNKQNKDCKYIFLDIKVVIQAFLVIELIFFIPLLFIHLNKFSSWFKLTVLYIIFSTGTLIFTVILINNVNRSIYKNVVKYDNLGKELEHSKMTIKLFGQLSHELKTPLNLIFSALQMQKPYINKVDLKTDDKQTRYTKIIKQNSYRLLRIINNLIDMTKIDANSFDIKVQNVDIVNVVREIVLSVENYIEEQERDFIFESSINKKIIACAPFEIERIILNLLSNAVKFTDYGDKIIVKIFDKKKTFISLLRIQELELKKKNNNMFLKSSNRQITL
jgi:signal transduction histidine kinase